MQKASALQLRQNMGAIIGRLQKTKEPILLEKGRKPVAVLISLEDYQTRFVDVDADIKRKELIKIIKSANIKVKGKVSSLELIREARER